MSKGEKTKPEDGPKKEGQASSGWDDLGSDSEATVTIHPDLLKEILDDDEDEGEG